MEAFEALGRGFAVALAWPNPGFALLGALLGTAVGVLPGIGPALTVSLLLPVTFQVAPESAFILFAGIYYGAMYGGSTAAILLNTPGESASVMTALEGNLMARAGRAGPALATAAVGSFVAGTVATVALSFLASPLARAALRFGPAEYFALMMLAFAAVASVLGASLLRGMTSLLFGIALGLVGIDLQTGQARFTLGIPELFDGMHVVVIAIGLFAVGETLERASRLGTSGEELAAVGGRVWMSRSDWRRSWKPWLRGAAIGFPLGALPAGGAELPTFVSYALERRLARRREDFGSGAIEGVAGPEAANNASAAGTLVPLLTLGLPTSATAAILLAAFQQYGLQPGPLLFSSEPRLVWGLIASLYLGNVMLLVLNLPLVGLWVRLLTVPRPLLYGGILVFSSVGAYSLQGSLVDVVLLYLVGLAGFAMRRFEIPLAPAVMGFILGPLAEQHLRRALAISQGDPTVLVTRPLSAVLLLMALAVVVAPRLWQRRVG